MYDENEWLQSATAHSAGIGAATATAMLSLKLAARGLLSPQDVEELRLGALMLFDEVHLKRGMSAAATEKLENIRKSLDDVWHGAAMAAERPS